MDLFRKNGVAIKVVVLFFSFSTIGQSVALSAGSDRIYPTDKVTLHRGDQVVGVYTKEAPLPEGSIISTTGRCAIRLDDLYLVAEDQSVFSISSSGRQRNLFIKQGLVYFKTSAIKRTLAFITPAGQISVHQIRLNAAFDDASIKGYVSVTEKQSELGVAEGGSMDVFTDEGLMTIQAGKKIILSQADMEIGLPEKEEPAAKPQPESKKGWSTGQKIAAGAVGVGAIAGILMGLGGGGGGGGGTVSPSSP